MRGQNFQSNFNNFQRILWHLFKPIEQQPSNDFLIVKSQSKHTPSFFSIIVQFYAIVDLNPIIHCLPTLFGYLPLNFVICKLWFLLKNSQQMGLNDLCTNRPVKNVIYSKETNKDRLN